MREIRLNGEPFEANADNTSLYHWVGELACFTHIFLETHRDEAKVYGGFVWCDDTAFRPLHEMIIENEWPMYLNQRPKDLKQSDINQWHDKHAHDLDNFNTLEDLDGSPA